MPVRKQRTAPLEATAWHHWERKIGVLLCRPLVGERTYVDDAVGTRVTISRPGRAKRSTS
jgi:hypothetical protein